MVVYSEGVGRVELGDGKKVIGIEEGIGQVVTLMAGDMEVQIFVVFQKGVVFVVRIEEVVVVVAVVLLFVVLAVVEDVIGIEEVVF